MSEPKLRWEPASWAIGCYEKLRIFPFVPGQFNTLIDHRSYIYNLSSCDIKTWKKIHNHVASSQLAW